MNLFGLNITRSSPPAEIPVSEAGAAWLHGDDSDSAAPLLTNAYQQLVWVYRAINVLAEQVANIPFLFSRGERGQENLITSGPLLDFYARPHPQINRFQYWELRIIWLLLRGESIRIPIYDDAGALSLAPSDGERAGVRGSLRNTQYAMGASDGRGIKGEGSAFRTPNSELRTASGLHAPRSTLRRVLILDPARFQHIIENNQLVGWRYTGFGPESPLEFQVFLPEEVWHEKLPNPFDFWRGMSPLAVAASAAKTDFAASAYMKGLIENNADAGTMVRTDQQLSPEQREQIGAALRQRKRRAGTPDRPILLWGVTEIVQPHLSSADLQFLENRKFSRSEICAAFGIPEEIVTTTDNAKYDVMSGSRLNFIENRVAPLCARLEAEEAVTVKAIDPAATGWFDLDSLPILQDARRTRLASAKTGFDMGIPFNELNRVLDLGFKPLPWGDTGYLPSKLQKLGQDAGAPAPSPASAKNHL
jgi:phage portal protein BeeE